MTLTYRYSHVQLWCAVQTYICTVCVGLSLFGNWWSNWMSYLSRLQRCSVSNSLPIPERVQTNMPLAVQVYKSKVIRGVYMYQPGPFTFQCTCTSIVIIASSGKDHSLLRTTGLAIYTGKKRIVIITVIHTHLLFEVRACRWENGTWWLYQYVHQEWHLDKITCTRIIPESAILSLCKVHRELAYRFSRELRYI